MWPGAWGASTEEPLVQRAFRLYGKLLGRRPLQCVLLCLTVCGTFLGIGWQHLADNSFGDKVIDRAEGDLKWSVVGSSVRSTLSVWAAYHGDDNRWAPTISTTIFTGRGPAAGTDVLNREALEEVYALYQKWMGLEVSVGSRTYTTRDLCARGNAVDLPHVCDAMTTTTTTTVTAENETTATTTTTKSTTTTPRSTTSSTSTTTINGDIYDWELFTETSTTETTTETREWNGTTTETRTTTSRPCLPSPLLPCLAISPIQCFREELGMNEPAYRFLDPAISDLDPLLLPYSTRPPFRGLNETEIKLRLSALRRPEDKTRRAGASRGCRWYTSQAFFPVDMWAGGVRWGGRDGGTLLSAEAVRLVLFLEGSARATQRMSVVKPDLADEDSVRAALDLLARRWQEVVAEHSAASMAALEATTVEPWPAIRRRTLENFDVSRDVATFASVGAAVVVFLCPLLLIDWRQPQGSHGWLGLAGFLLIALALCTAAGLYALCELRLTRTMILCLPILGISVGVTDVFVLIHRFSGLGTEFILVERREELLGEVLAGAGPGMTLSLLCGGAVFVWGALVPVEGISDLCVGALFVVILNYFVVINLMPLLLLVERLRVEKMWPDLHPAVCLYHLWMIRKGSDEGVLDMTVDAEESPFGRCLRSKYPRCLVWWPTRFFAVACMGTLLGVTIWQLQLGSIGLSPQRMLTRSDPAYGGLRLAFDRYALLPASLCVHDADLAASQAAVLGLFEAITGSPFATEGSFDNHLTTLYTALLWQAAYDAASANASLPAGNGTNGSEASSSASGAGNASSMPVLLPAQLAKLAGLNFSRKLPRWAPFGTAPSNATAFSALYQSMLNTPSTPQQMWAANSANGSRASLYLDLAGAGEFRWSAGGSPGTIVFSNMPFFLANVQDDSDYSATLQAIANAIAASPLKDNAFVFSPLLVYWQVLKDLQGQLTSFIVYFGAVVVIGAFVLTTGRVFPAVAAAFSCVTIYVEVVGLAAIFAPFDTTSVGVAFVSMGVIAEMVAHLSMALTYAWSDEADIRLGEALAAALPGAFAGILTVACLVLPLSLFPVEYFVRYLCGTFCLLAGALLLNVVFIVPAVLSLAELPARCCRPPPPPPRRSFDGMEINDVDLNALKGDS